MYILDEPSIGLHQRDNARLLRTLTHLRDLGNTVLVVEHDEEAIRTADHIVDIGPGAGVHGGEIVVAGPLGDVLDCEQSITGEYLAGKRAIPTPSARTPPDESRVVRVIKASGNNLRDVTVDFPVGLLTCVTGVSGSGKSTLVNQTLYPITARALNGAVSVTSQPYADIEGLDNLDKVVDIDQSPIGRTPPVQSGDLHGGLYPHSRTVRPDPGVPRQGLPSRPVQFQRPRRALRSVPGRRRHQGGDALPPRHIRPLRRLQGQTL